YFRGDYGFSASRRCDYQNAPNPGGNLGFIFSDDLLLITVEFHASPRRGFAAAPLKADRMVAMTLGNPSSAVSPFALQASVRWRSASPCCSNPAYTSCPRLNADLFRAV